MPSSSPPRAIPVSVDPKLAVTTAEQALALDKAFDDAFGPLDDRRDAAKTQETPKPESQVKSAPPTETQSAAPTETESPPDVEQEPLPGAKEGGEELEPEQLPADTKHPDDEPDEEVDKFKLHPDSRPEVVDVFRELRGRLKTERRLSKSQADELVQLKTAKPQVLSVSDPVVQKELEDLRGFRQRHLIFDDTQYQVQYEMPVRQIFDDIIADVKNLSSDQEQAVAWEKQIRGLGPDRLDKTYWTQGVIEQCADPIDKDRMIRKVSQLIDAQQKRDGLRKEMMEQPDRFEKFQHEQAAAYWKNFSVEAEDEARKLQPNLGEWAHAKDLTAAKNPTEKAAFEAHNAAQTKYEDLFKLYLQDAATQGPRGMTRVAVLAVCAEKYKNDLDAATRRNAKLTADLQKAQAELNKIAGARAKVVQPSTASTNGQKAPEATKPKAGKSLDSAFKDFFGPQ